MGRSEVCRVLVVILIAGWAAGAAALEWTIEVVDSQNTVGLQPSIALDQWNQPHIAYFEDTHNQLRLAVKTGTGWHIENLASHGISGEEPSLVVDDANAPHIAYTSFSGALMHGWLDNTTWMTETVDAVEGLRPSMALDRTGRLSIAYEHGGGLRYAIHDTMGWAAIPVIPNGLAPSLAIDSLGAAHISYHRELTGGAADLWYGRQTGTGWDLLELGDVEEAGCCHALALGPLGGVHIASSLHATPGKFLHFWSGGEGWTWQQDLIDNEGDSGEYASIAIDEAGRPHVAFMRHQQAHLIYAHWNGGEWFVERVDRSYHNGYGTSIAVDDTGRVHIGYYDYGDTTLKYATARVTSLWYDLRMQDPSLQAGDEFRLSRACGSVLELPTLVYEAIILDVVGYYWFWPAWTQDPHLEISTVPGNGMEILGVLSFTWPPGVGVIEGVRFWGGLLSMTDGSLVSLDWVDWTAS